MTTSGSGKVQFFAEDAETHKLTLTPVATAVVERRFELPGPTALNHQVWPGAAALAMRYWGRLDEERGLSDGFRRIARRSSDALAGRIAESA